MADTTESPHAKTPLRWRVKAWWEGYDPEVHRKESASTPLDTGEKRHEVHCERPERRWETARIALAQEVWGDGLAGPGGVETILDLVKPFGLTPARRLLDLGAGQKLRPGTLRAAARDLRLPAVQLVIHSRFTGPVSAASRRLTGAAGLPIFAPS